MELHSVNFSAETTMQRKATVTARQIEILKLICEQKSTKEIASTLNVSKRTIEGLRRKIFAKTQALNEAGLAIYAINHGINRDE